MGVAAYGAAGTGTGLLDENGDPYNTSNPIPVSVVSIPSSSSPVSAFSNKMRAEVTFTDISITSSSVYTDIYNYSGTGFLIGFNAEFNSINIVVKLIIDSEIIFDGTTISDLNSLSVTANSIDRRQMGAGLVTTASIVDWSLKYPIQFRSSIIVSARLGTGSTAQKLDQSVFYIQKDT